jgi:hypothetical protein
MPTAAQAYHAASPGDQVIGWKLDRAERDELLSCFPPRHANAVADHVTLRSRVDSASALPSETVGVIVGRSDDGAGVEAMVVQVDGSTERPDGGTYHVTWSLAAERQAVESNEVITQRGWEPMDPPVPVRLKPACFPRS